MNKAKTASKILSALIFSAFILYAPFFFRSLTAGFRVEKVAIDLPNNPAWSTEESPTESLAELQAVFAKPFSYLSHGGQSFVFESEDSRYIIKLFRRSTKMHPWRRILRHALLHIDKLEPEKKADRLFSACKLAFEQAKDLTGLVYIHLNLTENLLPSVRMKDRLGRFHTIDLNKCSFAVQYKGTPIRTAFQEVVEKKDYEQFIRLVEQFASLLQKRTERYLGNTDRKVSPNFGFLPDRAIEWDFGNYWVAKTFENPTFRKKETRVFCEHLQAYLDSIAPDWAADAWQILERS